MGSERSAIDAQLMSDCHHLGCLDHSQLLLHRNAALPWFILVPDTRLHDVLDLPEQQAQMIWQECADVSGFIKRVMGYPKVNFAGLGNVVAQMHLHIIGRREGDACWPRPVWGVLPEGQTYRGTELDDIQAGLIELTGLRPPSV
ncbi:MAG: HIT domain-containing protein [Pseudomonadota bacterium]